MRICRFNDDRIGVVRPEGVHDVTGIVEQLPSSSYPYPIGDVLIRNLENLRRELDELADLTRPVKWTDVSFLSPVANPSKIIGTPSNYRAHTEEADRDPGIKHSSSPRRSIEQQGLFLKANSALVGPSQGIALRFLDRRTDHEAELGIIIGKGGSDISEDAAYEHIAGYALAIDMVVRGPEDRSFRKSVDTYAVLGPWLVTTDEIPDPQCLDFELRVNGEVRQQSNTRFMLMSIARQVSWASSFYSLYPGDILMTGTCQGVGPVSPGDVIQMKIEAIGEMTVPVRAHGTTRN